MKHLLFIYLLSTVTVFSQTDARIYDIISEVSSQRIEKDITTLANFGTRHTLSDTVSNTRGIGAARRLKKNLKPFQKIVTTVWKCFFRKI